MAEERVLVVDDEPEFTQVLAERMQARGVDVDVVSDGCQALEKAKARAYDAVILDLAMPGMDGIETMRHLLEGNPDLQVIMLTGHATLRKGIEAMKLGAVDFLEKPADLQTLMEKIRQAQATRMLLVEKHAEEKIKGILESKSW